MIFQVSAAWVIHLILVWMGTRHTGRFYGSVFGLLCSVLWAIVAISQFDIAANEFGLLLLLLSVVVMVATGLLSGGQRHAEIIRRWEERTGHQYTAGALLDQLTTWAKNP